MYDFENSVWYFKGYIDNDEIQGDCFISYDGEKWRNFKGGEITSDSFYYEGKVKIKNNNVLLHGQGCLKTSTMELHCEFIEGKANGEFKLFSDNNFVYGFYENNKIVSCIKETLEDIIFI
jgi:hypothetical protein